MNLPQDIVRQLMHEAGTDSSGKWMGVNHAEKFAELVIEAYNKHCRESPKQPDQGLA